MKKISTVSFEDFLAKVDEQSHEILSFLLFGLQEKTGWWWLEPWNFEWLSIYSRSGRIIPTDELIFFRGVETTNQIAKVMNQDKSPLS